MVYYGLMLPDKSQIPEKEVKTGSQSHTPSKGVDALWSRIRRLTDQVQSIELALSTARRDINRIDRANYRGKDKTPAAEMTEDPGNGDKVLDSALFG